jgi:tetratricopeptide (TPR) repeat protein
MQLFALVGDGYGMSVDTIMQGWLALVDGDADASLGYSRAGYKLAEALDATYMKVMGLLAQGDALERKECWLKAAEVYHRILDLNENARWTNWEVSAWAGLARVAHMQGDIAAAGAYIDRVISYVDRYPSLPGTDNPLRIYLTCYRILREIEPPRAEDMLHTAFRMLQARAHGIDDPILRESFLENVPENREIVNEYRYLKQISQ